MEERLERSKSEKSTVIFSSEVTASVACQKLTQAGAEDKADKQLWLLRESSVPGLLTISYYGKGKYTHMRIGFVNGEWRFGPKDYHAAQEFSKRAEAAFSKALPDKSYDSLISLLNEHGFSLNNQLIPKAHEASRNEYLTAYNEDAFSQSSTAERYNSEL